MKEKSKNQERKHVREDADFRRFHLERVLNRDEKIWGVPTPHTTNPTNYHKWLPVHNTHLWNMHANPVPWPYNNNSICCVCIVVRVTR